MAQNKPIIYIFHGEDEFTITQRIAELSAKLGDATMREMNTSHLDGTVDSLDDLVSAVSPMPFLAERRLVILTNPTAYGSNPTVRDKFIHILEKVPASTALVLVEYHPLTAKDDLKKDKKNWLEAWGEKSSERAYIRFFDLPRGPEMVSWVQKQAKEMGGQFTSQAANQLVSLLGEDTRLADQEIRKLLTYVNFKRAVEVDDVETLTAAVREGDIFAMVDALGNRDGHNALGILHQLLDEQDALAIWGMMIRQFRLLLLARDSLDRGENEEGVRYELKIHPYVAKKLVSQARHFSLPALETIYLRLLEVDLAMKTSEMEADVSLETLVTSLTL
jgi:DNA polymerase III subunit delta